jgi:hypothetical protein
MTSKELFEQMLNNEFFNTNKMPFIYSNYKVFKDIINSNYEFQNEIIKSLEFIEVLDFNKLLTIKQ